jgi:hypothetical protein
MLTWIYYIVIVILTSAFLFVVCTRKKKLPVKENSSWDDIPETSLELAHKIIQISLAASIQPWFDKTSVKFIDAFVKQQIDKELWGMRVSMESINKFEKQKREEFAALLEENKRLKKENEHLKEGK